jgi:uncharacterized protein (TIGR00255 family)
MRKSKNTTKIGHGILSMTGFGRSEGTASGHHIAIEIRTVNNRFFEIGMKIPRKLNGLEGELREKVRQKIQRGRVNLLIGLSREGAGDERPLNVDLEMARHCHDQLSELNKKLGDSAPIKLEHLLHFSDLFIIEPTALTEDGLKDGVLKVLDSAVVDLVQMRRVEGQTLALDLLQRIAKIEEVRSKIISLSKDQPQLQMEKLQERIKQLITNSTPIDSGRLEQELAILADRLDITEECVRLGSHCQQFIATIGGEEPAGKRLGFLLQEMNREVNTISSKTASAKVSHLAVNLKEEVERIREQIQNLE